MHAAHWIIRLTCNLAPWRMEIGRCYFGEELYVPGLPSRMAGSVVPYVSRCREWAFVDSCSLAAAYRYSAPSPRKVFFRRDMAVSDTLLFVCLPGIL